MLTTVLVNFNHSRYLPLSLRSIFEQTRPPDELLVIDDASTDNSVEVIGGLLRGRVHARLIRNAVNQGTVANMNDGLRLARGTYIHFAAADDLFYPRFYETAIDLLNANPRAAIFSARSDVIDEDGRGFMAPIPRPGYPSRHPAFLPPARVARHLMCDDAWFMGNATVFRRECLAGAGGFSERLLSFADGYLCRFLSLKYGACFSPEILAAWRQMEEGFAASTAASAEKTKLIMATAAQEMSKAATVFPAGYAKRWTGRYEYDVRRRALVRRRARNEETASAVNRFIAAAAEEIGIATLFLRLRPWDLPEKIRQRLVLHLGLSER